MRQYFSKLSKEDWRNMKKYKKPIIIFFITYQIVGLIILGFNIDEIIKESQNVSQSIVEKITGGNK